MPAHIHVVFPVVPGRASLIVFSRQSFRSPNRCDCIFVKEFFFSLYNFSQSHLLLAPLVCFLGSASHYSWEFESFRDFLQACYTWHIGCSPSTLHRKYSENSSFMTLAISYWNSGEKVTYSCLGKSSKKYGTSKIGFVDTRVINRADLLHRRYL